MTAKRARPVRQLKAFDKIGLKAGEEKQIEFVIPYMDLEYYDWEMKKVPCEGKLRVYVGGDSTATLSEEIVV